MFFDRPDSGEISLLVNLQIDNDREADDIVEFEELALSAGAQPVAIITGSRRQPSPSYFVGSGKLEELQAAVASHKAEVVLFNHSLSPSQERNLERELKCRVIDRTGLILDIFAQRARSHEGKLQVELAQLEHLSTRLVRGWTHLERQKGGIGDIALIERHAVRHGKAEAGGEIVDHRHAPARVLQRQHRMAADIACAAGDECVFTCAHCLKILINWE